MRDLCEAADPAAIVRTGKGERIGALADILANTPEAQRDPKQALAARPHRPAGDQGRRRHLSALHAGARDRGAGARLPEKAEAIRKSIAAQLGGNLAKLVPGSPQAAELKRVLIEQGAWSQYLEVGIGPDAEIFTKAQPMAAVGHGMEAGLHPISTWNNPEPEVVLVVSSRGTIVGATLGNDVNLRDVEGRSALLLSKAKDNNASTAIGPFIRLFDGAFTLDTRAPHRGEPEGRGRGRLHAGGPLVDVGDRPRSGRPRRSRCSGATTSIPTAPCCTSAPCSRP